jgi:hypothetical protein
MSLIQLLPIGLTKALMPKRVFWPITLVIMGLIFLAQNMGYFPSQFWNLWPLILIVVGLGGLITSDREKWLYQATGTQKSTKSSSKKAAKSRARSRK